MLQDRKCAAEKERVSAVLPRKDAEDKSCKMRCVVSRACSKLGAGFLLILEESAAEVPKHFKLPAF